MRIGVVGAGKIGSMRVQTVKENSETELAAVLDINPALAEQAVAGMSAPALTELNAFLESQMDAVVVSTPPHLHEDACIGAFERGTSRSLRKAAFELGRGVPPDRRRGDRGEQDLGGRVQPSILSVC